MTKKYELVLEDSIEFFEQKLFRIRALTDFDSVKAGDLGGYIQSNENLSHEGNAWVSEDAKVCERAEVCDNAEVSGDAIVSGSARVCDDAKVYDNAEVWGNAKVSGNATVKDNTEVWGEAEISGNAIVAEKARVCGTTKVSGNAEVYGNVRAWEDAKIYGNAKVSGNAEVWGNAEVSEQSDLTVFKNNWSSGRHFTYTKSNKMWKVGCFYGTSQELIDKAYKDSKTSGDHYKAYVDFVETLERLGEE